MYIESFKWYKTSVDWWVKADDKAQKKLVQTQKKF